MVRRLAVAATLCLAPALHAQDVPYGTGTWERDSLGNHRAVVRVAANAEAVRAHIPWRRRDADPAAKRVVVTTASGERVRNAWPAQLSRESGDIVFQPVAGPGEYHVYWMPYTGSFRSNYPRITYRLPDTTATASWLEQVRGPWRTLPEAALVAIQARDSTDSFFPMELIATAAETEALLARHPGAAYLLFPEDRTRPIRLPADLPQRWVQTGANSAVTGEARRGEFYAFQAGVWAARQALESLTVRVSDLTGPGGATIPAAAVSAFNSQGVNWEGRPFARRVDVPQGRVQALWFGVAVPETAAPGAYQGTLTVTPRGLPPTQLAVRLTVSTEAIVHHGDDEPWRLARLRWLDSRLGNDTTVVRPYTPVRVRGAVVSVLGRDLTLGPSGWPARIASRFTPELTGVGDEARELLAAPIALVVEDTAGAALTWQYQDLRFTHRSAGAAAWDAVGGSGPITVTLHGHLEFDGTIEYTVALTAARPTPVRDVRLEVPVRPDAARYFMGLGLRGGVRPAEYEWRWDVRRNQDAFWVGDVNAGLQVTLRDERYVRPLNTNFYQLRPLVMPRSWQNGGAGGCRFRAGDDAWRAQCFGGPRTLTPGDTLWFNARLMVTPFHALDPRAQFTTRYYHAFKPIDTVRVAGANTINVHHANRVNPWINYPFLRPTEMRAYVDSAHAAGMRVKIYYTVRELTNRAPELWMLRSLGDEVLSDGPGGGHAWLQEHVGSNYITGWVVPDLRDIALVTSGISRWHNFYVAGLDWLVRNVGIDGLYIDDVAFDRTTMQRVRRVLERGRPGAMIDLHSANQFNPADGFAASANLYLEHFPYIDRLWFGEYFDYRSSADYWLVEMSGIPFGLMGEMLQDGGNPWRGMVFGMTARLPWAGDPRELWRAWDDFGITDATMIGWWSPRAPVTTGRGDVLATTYARERGAMVAVASWAADTADVMLAVDWAVLGLDARRARIRAPAIAGFQQAAEFAPGQAVRIAPGRGWLLVLEQR